MPGTGNAKPQAENAALMALEANFEQAVALQRQGKLADAERICSEVLRQQPRRIRALHLLGIIALRTRHIERAVELFGRTISLNHDYGEACYNRGLALYELKRSADALASYDRAIAMQPKYAKATAIAESCWQN
jgi:Tfp pilus assembly protein PilF